MAKHTSRRATGLRSKNTFTAGRLNHLLFDVEGLESRVFLSTTTPGGLVQVDPAAAALQVTQNVVATAPLPLLKSAQVVDGTSVRVNFNKVVTQLYVSKLKFSIPGLTITSVKRAVD